MPCTSIDVVVGEQLHYNMAAGSAGLVLPIRPAAAPLPKLVRNDSVIDAQRASASHARIRKIYRDFIAALHLQEDN
jgi:hypothetical protein